MDTRRSRPGSRRSSKRPSGPSLRAADTTDEQLIADLAEGYDVCVIGADKWHQLHDLTFYGGVRSRP